MKKNDKMTSQKKRKTMQVSRNQNKKIIMQNKTWKATSMQWRTDQGLELSKFQGGGGEVNQKNNPL